VRAFVAVIDVLPAALAIPAAVRAVEEPLSRPVRVRLHLRLASPAPRYPLRRRLMLRHLHVRSGNPHHLGMEGAQGGFRIGGEGATINLAGHIGHLPKTAFRRSRIHAQARAASGRKDRDGSCNADRSPVRNGHSPNTTSSGRLTARNRSPCLKERRSARRCTGQGGTARRSPRRFFRDCGSGSSWVIPL